MKHFIIGKNHTHMSTVDFSIFNFSTPIGYVFLLMGILAVPLNIYPKISKTMLLNKKNELNLNVF